MVCDLKWSPVPGASGKERDGMGEGEPAPGRETDDPALGREGRGARGHVLRVRGHRVCGGRRRVGHSRTRPLGTGTPRKGNENSGLLEGSHRQPPFPIIQPSANSHCYCYIPLATSQISLTCIYSHKKGDQRGLQFVKSFSTKNSHCYHFHNFTPNGEPDPAFLNRNGV